MSTVIQVSVDDSIRIKFDVFGYLHLPASLVLAVDVVMLETLAQNDALTVEPVEDGESNERFWEASIGNVFAQASTPWGAMKELARVLEVRS